MNKRSPQDLAEAIKDLAEIKKIEDSPILGNQTINSTPSRATEVPVGSRDAILISIDLSIKGEYKYLIKFAETNTTIYARIKNELGVHWAPEGKWTTPSLFVCEKNTFVHAEIIKDTFKWQISGAENKETIITPGATVIKRGNSTVTTHDDQVTISNQGLELTVDGEWAYINGKRICVKGSCFTPWIIPSNPSVWVAFDGYLGVFDLTIKEWINILQVDGIKKSSPVEGNIVYTDEYVYEVDLQSGAFTKNLTDIDRFASRGTAINLDGSTESYPTYPGMIDFFETDYTRYFFLTKDKFVTYNPAEIDPMTGTHFASDIINLTDDEFISIMGENDEFIYVLGKYKIYKVGQKFYSDTVMGVGNDSYGEGGAVIITDKYFYLAESWEHGFVAQQSYTDNWVGPGGAFHNTESGVDIEDGASGYPIYVGNKIYLYDCLTKTYVLIPKVGSFANGSYMTNQNPYSAIYSVTDTQLLINPLVGDTTQQSYDLPLKGPISLGIKIPTGIAI